MFRKLLIFVLLCPAFSFAQAPAIPDTPAGRALSAWLDAFNSGERAKLEAYIKKYDPSENVGGMMALHDRTGGFELLSVDSSLALHITFRIREKHSSAEALGSLRVKGASSGQVIKLWLGAASPGAIASETSF
jgi:hypothetical protein